MLLLYDLKLLKSGGEKKSPFFWFRKIGIHWVVIKQETTWLLNSTVSEIGKLSDYSILKVQENSPQKINSTIYLSVLFNHQYC